MAYSSLLNLPFIIALVIPALNMNIENHSGRGFFLSDGFVYPLIVITTFINGFGQGIAQPASGTFISDCATERSKGFFFAYFWAFYMGSQVIGSLISGIILDHIEPYWYSIIMSIILALAVLLLFFLKPPKVAESNFIREKGDSMIGTRPIPM
jgi:MFS family permease